VSTLALENSTISF